MQWYPHGGAVLGPSCLLHPSSRMQFHVHPQVTRTAEWKNVESCGKFLKRQPPRMHAYHGYCNKKCTFVGVLWFETQMHIYIYIVNFHHLPDSHLQSLQKVSSITMVTPVYSSSMDGWIYLHDMWHFATLHACRVHVDSGSTCTFILQGYKYKGWAVWRPPY